MSPENDGWVEVPLFGPDELAALRALDQKFIDEWPGGIQPHLPAQVPPAAEAPAPRPGGAST